MLSGDSMFPRIGDATQRAQLEARTLALRAAGIRTAIITALNGTALTGTNYAELAVGFQDGGSSSGITFGEK